ncbi:MAG: polyprenyl synthetase family protein [Flavobacteriaceae bacterium]|nr:polyprenyl synthetase family protein [Flavobacteriaceae bacterium]
MVGIENYSKALKAYVSEVVTVKEPVQLYEPIKYIVALGGKRLRPILTIMSCDFFGADYKKALPAALALELFHNFSLIHDDIMDQAPLRRGKKTVHHKWDLNTGILSGDAMLILAYQLFEEYEPNKFSELAKLFSKTALKVCEGQQYDVDFETKTDVTIPDYIKMIEYKTAVLLGAAMNMGAIVADASEECKNNSYEFGRLLGIAFQLQDDYLDCFGNPETFGKQIGGDIIANKKTYLYLKTLQNCSPSEAKQLINLFSETPENPSEKIKFVKEMYQKSGAAEASIKEIVNYTEKANSILDKINISEENKTVLKSFGKKLMNRNV